MMLLRKDDLGRWFQIFLKDKAIYKKVLCDPIAGTVNADMYRKYSISTLVVIYWSLISSIIKQANSVHLEISLLSYSMGNDQEPWLVLILSPSFRSHKELRQLEVVLPESRQHTFLQHQHARKGAISMLCPGEPHIRMSLRKSQSQVVLENA